MAYQIDKKTGTITIAGFEQGIAASPHKGLGDIKGLNISSIPGEVQVSYGRTRQSQYTSVTPLTLAADTASLLTVDGGTGIATGLVVGTAIHIVTSTITNLTAGNDYWVLTTPSGSTMTVASSYANLAAGTDVSNLGITGTATYTIYTMGKPLAWASTSINAYPHSDYFVCDSNGHTWYARPLGSGSFVGWRILEPNNNTGATGIFCFGNYVLICQSGTTNALRYKALNALGSSWASFQDLNVDSANNGVNHFSLLSHNGVVYICDGSWIDTLAAIGTFDPTNSATYTWTSKALNLPLDETANTIGEIASGVQTTLIIGGIKNVLYPWDGLQTTFGALMYLPENNTTQLVSVNNLCYIFTGSKGNIYITNGSSVTSVLTVPDYIANNQGTNQDPYFIWGGTMYLRGRIWFGVQAPNCGGIWSFVPTQNYFIQQDTGASLRMESQNSYGTYNGVATILFPESGVTEQQANGPQYFSGWDDGTSGMSSNPYGIDFSATTAFIGGAIIETDLIPTGTLLEKKTFSQQEYKLSAALVAGESIQFYYRQNLSDSFVSCGTVNVESSTALSGYFSANFEKGQWLQLRVVLTAITSSPSWCRLSEIIIR